MAGFFWRWLAGAAGLWLASQIVPGLYIQGFVTLFLAALALGLVNAFVRPVIVFITFPLTLMTLGLFLLVVNAAMLGLVSLFLPGFEIHGFWAALWGAVVVGLVSWPASGLIKSDRRAKRSDRIRTLASARR